jgi:hypothetical protein
MSGEKSSANRYSGSYMLDANNNIIAALHAHHKLVDGRVDGPTATSQ